MASIQGIYIALFGRPADPKGLAFFEAATKGGADLSAIGDLAGTEEYQSRFKGMDQTQIVTAIYKSLLGREPEPEGLAFWVEKLASKSLGINTIAIAVLDGARGTDRQTVAAKVKIADAFTASLDTPEKVAAYVGIEATKSIQSYLAGITAEKPGSTADLGAILTRLVTPPGDGGGAAPSGINVSLTAAADDLKGTAQDDTFSGTLGTDATFDAQKDKIDGGAGLDTLRLSGAGAVTFDGGRIRNIEKFIFSHGSGSGTFPNVDLRGVEGVSEVGIENVPQNGGIMLQTAKPVTLSFSKTQGAILLKDADLAGNADRLVVTLNRAGEPSGGGNGEPVFAAVSNPPSSAATGEEIPAATGAEPAQTLPAPAYEALAVTSTGDRTNYFRFENTPLAPGAKLTVDGTAGLYLTAENMTGTLAAIDASKASGGVTLENMLPMEGEAARVTLGSGNDTVILKNESEYFPLGENVTLDGGAGTDRLWVAAGSDLRGVKGFEILRLSKGGGDREATQSTAGFKTIELANLKNSTTLTDLADGTEIVVQDSSNNSTLTLKLAAATTEKSVTLKMAAQPSQLGRTAKASLNALGGSSDNDSPAIALVKIDSGALTAANPKRGDWNNIRTDDIAAKHVITGSGALGIDFLNKATEVDASKMTGALTLNDGYGAGKDRNHIISTGSGNDDIKVGTDDLRLDPGVDMINTGAGDDTIRKKHINPGDIIDGGDGTDTVILKDGGNDLSRLKNIEIVRIETVNRPFVQSAKGFSGDRIDLFVEGTTQQATVTNLANGKTVGLSGTFGIVTLKVDNGGAGANDVLNLRLGSTSKSFGDETDHAADIAALMLDGGLEALNIDLLTSEKTDPATGKKPPLDHKLISETTASHTITGASNLNLTTSSTKIDASAMTGKLNLTSNTNDPYQFTLGTGTDTVKLGGGGGTVALGKAGGNAQTGGDVITLATGDDTVVFVGSRTEAGVPDKYAGVARIVSFNATRDKLAFSADDRDFATPTAGGGLVTGLAKGAMAKGLEKDTTIGVQAISQDAGLDASKTANVSFFKFMATISIGSTGGLEDALKDAIGNGEIEGLAKGGNYLFSYRDASDQADQKVVLGIVNAGDDGKLTKEDFSLSRVSLVGVLSMDESGYGNLGADVYPLSAV